MSKSRPRQASCLRGLLGSLALLFLPGCGGCKTPKPSSDTTPPILKWSVHNTQTGTTQEIVGSGTISAGRGDTFQVTLFAENPGGVREITMSRELGYTCGGAGGLGQNIVLDTGIALKQTLQPDGQGNVLTKVFLIRSVDFREFVCGGVLDGVYSLHGTGENYSNGVTKEILSFNVHD